MYKDSYWTWDGWTEFSVNVQKRLCSYKRLLKWTKFYFLAVHHVINWTISQLLGKATTMQWVLSCIYPLQLIARCLFIVVSELEQCGVNKVAQGSKWQWESLTLEWSDRVQHKHFSTTLHKSNSYVHITSCKFYVFNESYVHWTVTKLDILTNKL